MASVNTMGINQVADVLNAVHQQVTGTNTIAPITNTQDFISVAQSTLRAGYDPVYNAISQVINRTIFAVREWRGNLNTIQVDNQQYGAMTRKISFFENSAVEDEGYKLQDGTYKTPFEVRLPKTVQMNFYGANVYQDWFTRTEDQMKVAFRGPDEFASFYSSYLVEQANKEKQWEVEGRRLTLLNFIGAKLSADTSNVIHLLTEWNTETGQNLTKAQVYAEHYRDFMQWVFARISALVSMMEERSAKFHLNLDDGRTFMRHTSRADARVILLARDRYQYEAMAMANTFHDNYLSSGKVETINFWQSIDKPDQISITPTYINASGATVQATQNVAEDNVLGVIFDRDALGISIFNEGSGSIYNPRQRTWNTFPHWTRRWWNDLTENGIVLMFD